MKRRLVAFELLEDVWSFVGGLLNLVGPQNDSANSIKYFPSENVIEKTFYCHITFRGRFKLALRYEFHDFSSHSLTFHVDCIAHRYNIWKANVCAWLENDISCRTTNKSLIIRAGTAGIADWWTRRSCELWIPLTVGVELGAVPRIETVNLHLTRNLKSREVKKTMWEVPVLVIIQMLMTIHKHRTT